MKYLRVRDALGNKALINEAQIIDVTLRGCDEYGHESIEIWAGHQVGIVTDDDAGHRQFTKIKEYFGLNDEHGSNLIFETGEGRAEGTPHQPESLADNVGGGAASKRGNPHTIY